MTQPGSFNTSPAIQPPSVELDRLLQPARHFSHPREVVEDQTLSPAEKPAILSSWASDACAVESIPSLRQMPGSPAAVTFDEVMDALQQLDGTHGGRSGGGRLRGPLRIPALLLESDRDLSS